MGLVTQRTGPTPIPQPLPNTASLSPIYHDNLKTAASVMGCQDMGRFAHVETLTTFCRTRTLKSAVNKVLL